MKEINDKILQLLKAKGTNESLARATGVKIKEKIEEFNKLKLEQENYNEYNEAAARLNNFYDEEMIEKDNKSQEVKEKMKQLAIETKKLREDQDKRDVELKDNYNKVNTALEEKIMDNHKRKVQIAKLVKEKEASIKGFEETERLKEFFEDLDIEVPDNIEDIKNEIIELKSESEKLSEEIEIVKKNKGLIQMQFGVKETANKKEKDSKDIKGKIKDVGQKVRSTAKNSTEKAKSTVKNLGDKAKETAKNVGDKTKNAAGVVKEGLNKFDKKVDNFINIDPELEQLRNKMSEIKLKVSNIAIGSDWKKLLKQEKDKRKVEITYNGDYEGAEGELIIENSDIVREQYEKELEEDLIQFSEEDIAKIDPMVYKMLKTYDEMNSTGEHISEKSIQYVSAMTSDLTDKQRKEYMKSKGIKITYDMEHATEYDDQIKDTQGYIKAQEYANKHKEMNVAKVKKDKNKESLFDKINKMIEKAKTKRIGNGNKEEKFEKNEIETDKLINEGNKFLEELHAEVDESKAIESAKEVTEEKEEIRKLRPDEAEIVD